MAAYLDSAGNVNTAVANDVQNFVFANRQAAATFGVTQAAVASTGAQLVSDGLTGLTSAAVTDV
jgi:formaldehyde-activating enzyme involved in methanogenesis